MRALIPCCAALLLLSACPSWPTERPLCDRAGLRCCLPDTLDGGTARYCAAGLVCGAAGTCEARVDVCNAVGRACCEASFKGGAAYCNEGFQCVAGRCAERGGCTGAACDLTTAVDLLVVVDNTNSMADNQANFARSIDQMVSSFVDPPLEPGTTRRAYPAATSLQVAVVSTDLGTPGYLVPSCANSDAGDDGLFNPTRSGAALRAHPPWSTAPPGRRPASCQNDPNQFPAFLAFDPRVEAPGAFTQNLRCVAYLSVGGCGLEQPLEAIYRALIVHDARARVGNRDPNAGFLRDSAALTLLVLSDEDDGSVRDCRYAETGVPCAEATSVFDFSSSQWASTDINLRFYMYSPGTAQDPTWSLDRYIERGNDRRGLLALKPPSGRVVFGAITGIPLSPPRTSGGAIDWINLLGALPDGSDGYVGMSPEGPISMRQRNPDMVCRARVVPACRREGTTASSSCDPAVQYFAWPARRLAQVVQRFEEARGTGVIGSICANSYASTLSDIAARTLRP